MTGKNNADLVGLFFDVLIASLLLLAFTFVLLSDFAHPPADYLASSGRPCTSLEYPESRHSTTGQYFRSGGGGSLTLLCRIVQAAAVPYCNSNYTTHNSEVSALTTAGDFRITFSSRDHLHGSVSLNLPRAGVPPAYLYQLFFPAAASAPRALRPEQAASPYNAARQIICGHRSALRSTKNKSSQEYFPGVRFHSRYFCSGPRPDKLLVENTKILGGSWRTEALKSHLGAQN